MARARTRASSPGRRRPRARSSAATASLRDTDNNINDFSSTQCAGTIVYDGGPTGTGTQWGTAANWRDTTTNADRLPTTTDHVCIPDLGIAGVTFDGSSGTATVLSVTAQETVNVTNGTLNMTSTTQPSTFAVLNFSGGVIGGAGSVTITNNLTWSGGSWLDTGSTTVAPGATLALGGPANMDVRAGRTFKNLSTSTATWSAGANLRIDNGSLFENDGIINVDGDQDVSFFNCCTGVFKNVGTLRKISGSGESLIDVTVQSTGTVDVQSGGVAFGRDVTSSGPISVAAGAAFRYGGGIQTYAGSLSGGAGSSATFDGGTVTVDGSLNVPTVNVSGSTATLNNASTAFTNLNVSSGTMSFSQPVTPTNLTMTGGTLGGVGTVTVGGSLSWSGGTMQGAGTTTVSPAATISLTGTSNKDVLNGRTVRNLSTTPSTWTGTGNLRIDNGSMFENAGQIDVSGDQDMSFFNCCTGVFKNSGTFRKTSGTGDTILDITVQNVGTFAVNSGTVSLGRDGAHTGAFNIGAAGTLRIAGGTNTSTGPISGPAGATMIFDSGSIAQSGAYNVPNTTVSGGSATLSNASLSTATLNVSSGGIFFNQNVSPATVNLSGGSIGGTGLVTVGGAFSWSGGTMSDARDDDGLERRHTRFDRSEQQGPALRKNAAEPLEHAVHVDR